MMARGTPKNAYLQLGTVTTTVASGNKSRILNDILVGEVPVSPFRTDRLFIATTQPAPMTIESVRVLQQANPILIGKDDSPLFDVMVTTRGNGNPQTVGKVTLRMAESTDLQDIARVRIFYQGKLFGDALSAKRELTFTDQQMLTSGDNTFQIACEMKPTASLDHTVDARFVSMEIDGAMHEAKQATYTGPQRIGVALRTAGQDDCHTYRIPGLATSNQGTLISVYDNRYGGNGDLPNDINVGMSRSFNGGQTWDPMTVIMDMGDDPNWRYDGIGDPAILVDRETGRIWVAATWSHGDRSWHGSGPGMEPEETGQLMLAFSDDNGETWSKPRNITKQIKKPEWRFVLQGPGKGITMRDGTLVFPAQFRGVNDAPVNGKPSSTLIYSRDRGETWTIGTGVKIDTTEAQVVELGDGSLMINCRDDRNRSPGDGRQGRTVAITKDLGKTWKPHPTDRQALIEPNCMASLIRIEHKTHGALLVFSNPASIQSRSQMSLKVSRDEGMTWPESWHTLYDARPGAGYSCLT
ncbi:MAG: exo-alpha-sialidase, partial [Verrucomicrobiales bacterium]